VQKYESGRSNPVSTASFSSVNQLPSFNLMICPLQTYCSLNFLPPVTCNISVYNSSGILGSPVSPAWKMRPCSVYPVSALTQSSVIQFAVSTAISSNQQIYPGALISPWPDSTFGVAAQSVNNFGVSDYGNSLELYGSLQFGIEIQMIDRREVGGKYYPLITLTPVGGTNIPNFCPLFPPTTRTTCGQVVIYGRQSSFLIQTITYSYGTHLLDVFTSIAAALSLSMTLYGIVFVKVYAAPSRMVLRWSRSREHEEAKSRPLSITASHSEPSSKNNKRNPDVDREREEEHNQEDFTGIVSV
jgi:hypothetical protein